MQEGDKGLFCVDCDAYFSMTHKTQANKHKKEYGHVLQTGIYNGLTVSDIDN